MNRIKEFRLKNGMTQIELAKALNISQGSVSGYETGRFEPDVETMKRMAELFNTSIDNLFGSEASLKSIGDALYPISINRKLKRLTVGLMNLPGNDLDRIDKMLTAAYPEFFTERNDDDDA